MPEGLKAILRRLGPEQRLKVLKVAKRLAMLRKARAYKFETPNGRAPYDRETEREINRRLTEELNGKPKTKEAT